MFLRVLGTRFSGSLNKNFVMKRMICDDIHYNTIPRTTLQSSIAMKTIPKPTCLHTEAQIIARMITRHVEFDENNSIDNTKFDLAYEEALKVLKFEFEKVKFKAISSAKQVVKSVSEE